MTVRAVARDPAKYQAFYADMPRVTVVRGDVTKPDTLPDVLRGATAAVFAAQAPDGVPCEAVDRDGCINVAKACHELGVKLIVVSSVWVSPKHACVEPRSRERARALTREPAGTSYAWRSTP